MTVSFKRIQTPVSPLFDDRKAVISDINRVIDYKRPFVGDTRFYHRNVGESVVIDANAGSSKCKGSFVRLCNFASNKCFPHHQKDSVRSLE